MTRVLACLLAALLVVALFVATHRSSAGPSRVLQPAVVTVVGPVGVDDSARYRPQVGRRTSRPHHCTAGNWRHRLKPAEKWIDAHESGLNPAAREPTTGA